MPENKKRLDKSLSTKILRVLGVLLLTVVLSLIMWELLERIDKLDEETKLWKEASKIVTSENNKCELLRIRKVIKTYNPKEVKLSVSYYGGKEGFSYSYSTLEIPVNMDVSFVDNESWDYQYAITCFNEEGFVESINEYALKRGK